MTIKENILCLFEKSKELSISEISEKLQASKQMVHLVMKQLLLENKVEKLGRTPKTIYRFITLQSQKPETIAISEENRLFLKNNFLMVTESGNLIEGIDAFDYWCKQRKLPTEKTLTEFIATKKKYNSYYNKQGNIDGIEKLKGTKGYDKIWLDELYYLDFYAIDRFGETRLGTLLHYAKQGQSKFLMRLMMDEIASRIEQFVRFKNVDAIAFIPPTIRREVQLMKFIQTHLKIALPVIELKKIGGIIPVPQKSLSKLDERIRNAENTFAVTDQQSFNHVLLIDDAVESGSTLNQIAGKIKSKQVGRRLTGLAIVGSFKGFDVLTDV